ncbi:hypothetical protein KDA_70920 [Dictyobacter alpinus]|uniref:Uncharacterized protein n=1 Tax=Dictyobacter alpinus TaxID=2014873 RepID=A0A402BJS7_9CHLR|nr:hypothetical protein KDA_70920 [Dictyobacter alpinus]
MNNLLAILFYIQDRCQYKKCINKMYGKTLKIEISPQNWVLWYKYTYAITYQLKIS